MVPAEWFFLPRSMGFLTAAGAAAQRAFDKPEPIPYTKSMCIICVDIAKGTMTTKEARRALGEMAVTLDKSHVAEVEQKLREADANAKKSAP